MTRPDRPALAAAIGAELAEGLRVTRSLAESQAPTLAIIAETWLVALAAGGKILLFGNGGSAADAQHIAAELVGRFRRERMPLPALALTTDTSVLTAVGNDSGFEEVFARQVAALGRRGDVAVAISTSGRSANVLRAVAVARAAGLATVGLTGQDGGELAARVDVCLRVPAASTAHIQQGHLAALHAVCEVVEAALAPAAEPASR